MEDSEPLIQDMLININFSFDFLGLDNVQKMDHS